MTLGVNISYREILTSNQKLKRTKYSVIFFVKIKKLHQV